MSKGVEFNRKAAKQGTTSRYSAIMSEGLAQGLYVTAGVGFEPVTLRMKDTEPLSHHAPNAEPTF